MSRTEKVSDNSHLLVIYDADFFQFIVGINTQTIANSKTSDCILGGHVVINIVDLLGANGIEEFIYVKYFG
ncbi:uncharacterized protein METZ01_LOCUS340816, partial [marine metagenome]